jgi:hypothetical protein
LIRKRVPLKEVVSWLKKGQYVPFLREKRPFKKVTPKAGTNIGAITGILLRAGWGVIGLISQFNPLGIITRSAHIDKAIPSF